MIHEITVRDLASRLEAKEALILLDVREPWEHETAALPESLLIPMRELPTRMSEIPSDGRLVVVYCHHGVRSWQAAHFLQARGVSSLASLAGGIDAWSREIDPRVPIY